MKVDLFGIEIEIKESDLIKFENHKTKFTQLEKDSNFLGALQAAGVDNWDGYATLEILEEE